MKLLWHWLLMVALTSLTAWSVSRDASALPDSGRCLIIAGSAILVACLLLPLRCSNLTDWLKTTVQWITLAGFVAVCVMAADLTKLQSVIFALGGAVAVVMLLVSGTAWLCTAWWDIDQAKLTALTLLALSAAAPLWLGPLAAAHADNQTITNAIVAASPISYLAVVADYDYLRNTWFYQYTPYGGLRYAYPSASMFTAIYLILAALLGALRWWLLRHSNIRVTSCPTNLSLITHEEK